MTRLFAKLFSILALALVIFAATRGLIRALPGDPLDTLIAESGTSLSVDALRRELHLDRPYWQALASDLERAAHGDFGISIISKRPIAPLLVKRFLKTLELTALSLLFSVVLSLALGLTATHHEGFIGRSADHFCTFYGALVTAMPTPWIGPFLMILFCVWIPLFPLGDHVFLPALTLALSFTGFWARLIRERVRETLVSGAAPGARARGVPEWKVILKYGLAPASGALLAYLGAQIGGLMAGAFITEVIFDWQGMGSLLVESVLKRDYPVVESATFIAALIALIGTSLGEWAQDWVDPRLRERNQ